MRNASPSTWIALLSLVALGGLVALLARIGDDPGAAGDAEQLTVYCAAGIAPPIEELAHRYEAELGTRVELVYGGSGTLLGNISIARRGDLYIAGDDSFVEIARGKELVEETLPLARMRPVIGVARGNPKRIAGLNDLLRDDVAVGLANPDAAAVGKIARRVLTEAGVWEPVRERVVVFKPTVNELANDIALGAVDAAVIWDATAGQQDAVDAVSSPELAAVVRTVSLGVLRASERPAAALRFARYLAARDAGAPVFARHGYDAIPGDRWVPAPRLQLLSGAMMSKAVDATIAEFERREGVTIDRTYNGCGILVAQMKTGKSRPDAYFSCDVTFLDAVQPMFEPGVVVARNRMVILVQPGNPKRITSLADLARDDLRIGLADPDKSALGALTDQALARAGVLEAIRRPGRVDVGSPTGDLLVNQMRSGALDAAVVYRSNAALSLDHLDIVEIDDAQAEASQPFAIAVDSDCKQLLERLRARIAAAESRRRFEELGFVWQLGENGR